MRTSIFLGAALIAALGCTRGTGNVARGPVHPTASGAAPPTTHYDPSMATTKNEPVYDTQKGFENRLPPPDPVGGGPAVDSDVGGAQWNTSEGTFVDDPSRQGKSAPKPGRDAAGGK